MIEIIIVIIIILIILYYLSDNKSKDNMSLVEKIKNKRYDINTSDPLKDYIYARQVYLLNDGKFTKQDVEDLGIIEN